MARINKGALTRMEIVEVALNHFLEDGYSNTTMKMLCTDLGMSNGNTAFYFRTKEHMLAELVDMLCKFQWKLIDKAVDVRRMKIGKVFAMDYRSIGKRVLQEFKEYVAVENDRAIRELIGR